MCRTVWGRCPRVSFCVDSLSHVLVGHTKDCFRLKQAQNPGQHHEPSNAVEGSSSQVAVLESEDLLASIVACIFDKPSYMTLVYVVSKAFHHAFHHARKINNGYWRRTNPPPPPRRPLPMRLKTTCNGQECAFVQKGSKLLPLIKEKYNLTVDGMFL